LISDPLVSAMKATGHEVHIVNSLEATRKFLRSKQALSLDGIVHLWGMGLSEEHPDAPILASLEVVQMCIQRKLSGKNWFVTKGAQAVVEDDAVSPWQSQVWGFGRTLQVENPSGFGGCIDLGPTADQTSSDIEMLVRELCCNNGETEIAFRQKVRRVGRLVKLHLSENRQFPLELNP